ncbi:MAG: hypothetical protein MJ081_05265, partial [Ruminococcus sp.]|nr:hypothetical protein [Ruminococcus sp.]
MQKSMWKRITSGVTSALLALTYGVPNNLSEMKAKAADAADGLPIIDTPFQETFWYMDNPLGVAGNFHLFAFDTIELDGHCNGNVATPNLIFNTNNANPNQDIGRVLNVVTKSFKFKLPFGCATPNISYGMGYMTDFLVPKDYEIWGNNTINNDRVKVSYPTVLYDGSNIDNTGVNMFFGKKEDYEKAVEEYNIKLEEESKKPEEEREPLVEPHYVSFSANVKRPSYIAHAGENIVPFEKLRTFYEKMSEDFAAEEGDKILSIVEESDENDPSKKISVIHPDLNGKNVLNITAKELAENPEVTFDYINYDSSKNTYLGTQEIIINIDLEKADSFTWNPKWIYKTADGEILKDGEIRDRDGTNIIYNFYNGKEGKNRTVLTINATEPPIGIIFAPTLDLELGQFSGSAVANKIHTTNETHAALYLKPLKEGGDTLPESMNITANKVWSDGADAHENDTINVSLYVSYVGEVTDLDGEISKRDDLIKMYGELLEKIKSAEEATYTNNDTFTRKAHVDGENTIKMYGSPGDDNVYYDIDELGNVFSPRANKTNKIVIKNDEVTEEYYVTTKFGKVVKIEYKSESDNKFVESYLLNLGSKEISGPDWKTDWTGLDVITSDGMINKYYLKEDVPEGYTVSYDGNGANCGNRTITITNSKEGSTPPGPTKNNVKINKVDVTGDKEVIGAHIAVYRFEGSENTKHIFGEWDSDGDVHTVLLDNGKYILEETAVDGQVITDDDENENNEYDIISSTVEFTVENGAVTLDSTNAIVKSAKDVDSTTGYVYKGADDIIYICDAKKQPETTDITISKKGFDTDKTKVEEIKGDGKATFTLSTKTDGVSLKNVTASEGVTLTYNEETNTITFEGNASEIKGLADGEYTLTETVAPNGYDTVSSFTFKIENGAVAADETVFTTDGDVRLSPDGKTITVLDKKSDTPTTTTTTETTSTTTTTTLAEVVINKIELGGENVAGALLKLTGTRIVTNEDGTPVTNEDGTTETENIVFEVGQIILADGDTDAKIINSTGEALVWMSGSDSVTVKLYDGEYTLHEEAAPSGYLVATDIKFTIENGVLKDMEKVDMTDDKIVVTIDK